MQSRLVQLSVVIPAKSHNPTLLNPDFLSIRDIVPAAWGWELAKDAHFTTPAGSQVLYTNRVAVFVDQSRVQVIDNGEELTSSKIVDIARGYVTILPHIPYTAVGINFQSIVETNSPRDYLKSRFVKNGPWDTSAHPVIGAGVRFLYGLPGEGELLISLDAAQFDLADSKSSEVILINGNCHRSCHGYPSEQQALTHLARFNDDLTLYRSILADVLAEVGD
jgi:hypothetical protein